MRKKFTFRLIFLTPLVALFMIACAFLVSDYPDSLAKVKNYLSPAQTADISLPLSLPVVKDLKSEHITKLETRIDELQKLLQQRQDGQQITIETARNILSTTVKISRGSAIGTGVVIFDNQIDDLHYTYILTNAHVVADSTNIEIIHYDYIRNASISSTTTYPGKVIGSDVSIDLALIEIQTPEQIVPASEFDTLGLYSRLTLYQDVYIAGCPLGNPPLITNGNIGYISDTHNVVTAFAIFGSSGGGLYNRNGQLIGIVRGVSMIQLSENNRIPESSLTHVIPGPLVKSWLLTSGFSFILHDGSHKDYIIARKVSKSIPFEKMTEENEKN